MSDHSLQFLSIHWLILLPLFWVYWLWWFAKHAKGHSHSMADIDIAADNHYYYPLSSKFTTQIQAESSGFKSFAFWWQGIVVSLLIISLAQPILIGEKLPDPPPERDIIFVVDTSVSMQLKDYNLDGKAISRMELLHHLLDEFASNMVGERIAVIVFGESAHVLVPLSNDQGLIRAMLSRVTTTLAGRYSAVGDALLMSLFISEADAKLHPSRHQTVIVFTDAHESLGQVTPSAAADLLAEKSIPIFTVAIGSSHKGKKEVAGGLYQPVNIALLEDISQRTQGASYQVSDGDTLQKSLQAILKQRQNTAIPIPHYQQYPLYRYPLLLALLLLGLVMVSRLFHTIILVKVCYKLK